MTIIRISIYRGPTTSVLAPPTFIRTYNLEKREKIILPEESQYGRIEITLEKEADEEGSR